MKKTNLILLLFIKSTILYAEKFDEIVYFKNYSDKYIPIFLEPGEENLAFKSLEPGFTSKGFIKSKVIQNFENKSGMWIEFEYEERKAYLHSSLVVLSKTKETFDENIFSNYFYSTPLIKLFKIQENPETFIFNKAKSWGIDKTSNKLKPLNEKIHLNEIYDLYSFKFNLYANVDYIYLYNNKTSQCFIPDEPYFEYHNTYENGKIFEGVVDKCKNCSGQSYFKTIIISENEIIELPFPSKESSASFDFVSGDYPYFDVKIHNNDTLFLYSIIYYYTLKEDLIGEIDQFKVSNYDKKIVRTIFIKIDNLYKKPFFETIIDEGIPKKYISQFNIARPLKKQ